jgi:hypothetical protein
MLDLAGNDRAGAFHALDLTPGNATLHVVSFIDIAHRRMFRHSKHETRVSNSSGKDPDAPPCPHCRTLTGNRDIGDVKTDNWRRSPRRKVRC